MACDAHLWRHAQLFDQRPKWIPSSCSHVFCIRSMLMCLAASTPTTNRRLHSNIHRATTFWILLGECSARIISWRKTVSPTVLWKQDLYHFGYVVIYSSFGIASCILTNKYGPRQFALPASYLGMFLILVGDVLLIYLPLRRMRKHGLIILSRHIV